MSRIPSTPLGFAALAFVCTFGLAPLSAAEELGPHAALNGQFKTLVATGHDFDGLKLKLPPPTLPDGLDAAGQQKAMSTVADRNRSLEDLLKNSVVSPFVLKLAKVESIDGQPLPAPPDGTPKRVLRQLDLWFVAYGDVRGLTDEEQVKGVFDVKDRERADGLPVKSGTLGAEEIAKRKLPIPQAGAGEDFRSAISYSTFVLLDDVLISTTRMTTHSRTPESTLLAAAQDARFDADAEFPNRWQPIVRDPQGKVSAGEPHPFAGGAFYLKITPLKEPAGANFIELHQLFEEPYGWFQGGPKLSSKLGIVVQDEVRRFRKKLSTPK